MKNDKRLIDANALIRRFAYYHAHSYGKAEYAYGVAIDEALNAPTVDAVPVVHGRWKYCPPYESIAGFYLCSACGKLLFTSSVLGYKYCPYCGAKMDGGA